MAVVTLYAWGPIVFQVYPLNVGEVDHTTATEWARKEIAGSAIYREWVGENEEEIHLRGKVFPHYFAREMRDRPGAPTFNEEFRSGGGGGLSHLDVMDNMRRLGQAHTLIRGDGWVLGWFVIERLSRGHSYLWLDGVGQQIAFEAVFQRVPVADAATYFSALWGTQQ